VTSQKQKRRLSRYNRAGAATLLVGLAAAAITSCIYDADQRCGEGQVVYEDGTERCVCAEGWVPVEDGCVQCGSHEVSGASGCVCEDGYGRLDPTRDCEPCGDHEITSAMGACECEPGYARTSPEEACEEGSAGGCSSDDDCTDEGEGARCDLRATVPFCVAQPSGLNEPCTSDADCTDFEATYCDTFVTNSCLVQGCTLAPDNCFPGTECCDLTSVGIAITLCVEEGECTT